MSMSVLPSSSILSDNAASYHPEQAAEVAEWNKGKFLPIASLPPCDAATLSAELNKIEDAATAAFEELEHVYDEIQFASGDQHAKDRLSKARSTLFNHVATLQNRFGIYDRVATVRELHALPELMRRVQSVAVTLLLALTKAFDVDALVGKKWTDEFAFFRAAIPKLFGEQAASTADEIGQQCDAFIAELAYKKEHRVENLEEQYMLDVRKALYYQMLELAVTALEAKGDQTSRSFAANLSKKRTHFCDGEVQVDLLNEEDLQSDAPLRPCYLFGRNTSRTKPPKAALPLIEKIETRVAKNICGLLRDQTAAIKKFCGPERSDIDYMWNARCIDTLHQMLIREFKELGKQEATDPVVGRIVGYVYGLFSGLESAKALSDLTIACAGDKGKRIFGFLELFSGYIEAIPRFTTEREKMEKLYKLIMQFCPQQEASTEHERVRALYEYVEALSDEPKTKASHSPDAQGEHFLWRTQDYMREILAKKVAELVALTEEEEKVASELLRRELVYKPGEVSQKALPAHVTTSLTKQIIAALFLKGDAPHNTALEIEFYMLNKYFSRQLETTLAWFDETKKIFMAYDVELGSTQVKAAVQVATLAFEARQEKPSLTAYAAAWHHYFAYQKTYGPDKTLRGWLDAAQKKHPALYPEVIESVITSDIKTWPDYATGLLQLFTEKGPKAKDGYLLRLVAACLYGAGEDELFAQARLQRMMFSVSYDSLRESLGPSIRILLCENTIKKLCISAKLHPSDFEKVLLAEQEPSDRLQLARSRLKSATVNKDISVVQKDKYYGASSSNYDK